MGWTQVSAGQTLTAAILNDLGSYASPLTQAKSVTTSRNTTTTATADPELAITLKANRTYLARCRIHVTSAINAAGHLRTRWAWTNTASVTWWQSGLSNALASGTSGSEITSAASSDTTSPTTDVGFGASTSEIVAELWAEVIVGGSDIVLTLEWAQSTSNGNNTSVLAGSDLYAWRLA